MTKLNIKEALEIIGISRATLYRNYINAGKLSIIKENNKIYVELSEIIRVFPDAKYSTTLSQNKIDSCFIDAAKDNNIAQLIQSKDDMIKFLMSQIEDYKKQVTHLQEMQISFQEIISVLTDNKSKKKFLGIF